MNEELIREALRIIRARAARWQAEIDKDPSSDSYRSWLHHGFESAYTSSANILEAALEGNTEVMAQANY